MVDAVLSAEIGKQKIDEILQTGTEAVITAYQQCVRTKASYAMRNKISLEVLDIVQLIQKALRIDRTLYIFPYPGSEKEILIKWQLAE